jgi:hypothetical protein
MNKTIRFKKTLAGVAGEGEEEKAADQTKNLHPPGTTRPPTPTTDPPDVTTRDPTTTAEDCLGRSLDRGQHRCLTMHKMMEVVGPRTGMIIEKVSLLPQIDRQGLQECRDIRPRVFLSLGHLIKIQEVNSLVHREKPGRQTAVNRLSLVIIPRVHIDQS